MTTATGLTPAFEAVACYHLPETSGGPAVADFRTVIGSLATTGIAPFTTQDLTSYLDAGLQKEEAKEISFLTGHHTAGLALAIALVTDDAGKKIYMPIIGDTVENKTLVICPAGLRPGPAADAQRAGLTYVITDQQDAKRAVNNFLGDFAAARGAKGKPLPDLTPTAFCESLLRTLCRAADFSHASIGTITGTGEIAFPAGTGPADLLLGIARGEAPPAIYAAAVKPGTLQGSRKTQPLLQL